MLDRPYGMAKELAGYKKVLSYVGSRYTTDWLVDEREHPYTRGRSTRGCALALGRQDAHLGPGALRLGPQDFKAKSHDGYGEDWPDLVRRHRAVVRQGRPAARHFRHGREPAVDPRRRVSSGRRNSPAASRFSRKPSGRWIATSSRAAPVSPPRGSSTTSTRARCMGRGRCGRGCDISANFHSPTALIYPARDTGNCEVRTDSIVSEVLMDEATNKARGVRVIDRKTRKS